MKKISSDDDNDDDILGVTSVHDELFVLRERNDNQVAVYSINDYQLVRHLNVPEFEADSDSDMTSCVRHKCLYMSDPDNGCIHRYELRPTLTAEIKRFVGASSAISKWSVLGRPVGLSVTRSCNLLVTCHYANKLVE